MLFQGFFNESFFNTSMLFAHPLALEPEGGGTGSSASWRFSSRTALVFSPLTTL